MLVHKIYHKAISYNVFRTTITWKTGKSGLPPKILTCWAIQEPIRPCIAAVVSAGWASE